MKPTIYPNCKLYYFDRKTLEFGTINPNLVEIEIVNGIAFYSLISKKDPNFLIVQAMNTKKASAKFLTLILRYGKGNNIRKNRKDS